MNKQTITSHCFKLGCIADPAAALQQMGLLWHV